MILNNLKKLLETALISSGEERIKAIKEFQNIVWDDTSIRDEDLNNTLTDIAYVLDFYEPNEEWRKEDISYYGDEQLERLLKEGLKKLKTIK